MGKYFYHVTDKEHLKGIMETGLIPQIGENSQRVNEKESFVYLCRAKDIPYWKILLNKKIVLKISGLEESDTTKYQYDTYAEYVYSGAISREQISISHSSLKEKATKAMEDLCESYLYTISKATELAARYYTTDSAEKDVLKAIIESILAVKDYLNYSSLSKKTDKSMDQMDGL